MICMWIFLTATYTLLMFLLNLSHASPSTEPLIQMMIFFGFLHHAMIKCFEIAEKHADIILRVTFVSNRC